MRTKAYKSIIFDWDGTAVPDRKSDTTDLVKAVKPLLLKGLVTAVVTGTNIDNIAPHFAYRLPGNLRRRILISANRGSELFGFDYDGNPIKIYARQAADAEERLMDAAGDEIVGILTNCGINCRLIRDRLNRRKIDLLPEWEDPPKSQFNALLERVRAKLSAGSLTGGIAGVIRLTEETCKKFDISLKITSDIKHVELGLTDKRDGLDQILEYIEDLYSIRPRDILIAGDEFGDIGGTEGSDFRMFVPGSGADCVSVGIEPEGVPEGIFHQGGGPHGFIQILRDVDSYLEKTKNEIIETDLGIGEKARASVFSLSNGEWGLRGNSCLARAEAAGDLYAAGLYFQKPGEDDVPDLVSLPDPLRFRITLNEEAIEKTVRKLDFKNGALIEEGEGPGDAVFKAVKFLSHDDRKIAGITASLTAGGKPLDICWESPLKRPSFEDGVEEVLHSFSEDDLEIVYRSVDNRHFVGLTIVHRAAFETKKEIKLELIKGEDEYFKRIKFSLEPGESVTVEKVVVMVKDDVVENAVVRLVMKSGAVKGKSARQALNKSAAAFGERLPYPVSIEGDYFIDKALRFSLFHLLQTANPENPHVSIPAKGLSGPGYKGHIFWDTEIFMLPFFTWCRPETASSLLSYRYNTLKGALGNAAYKGYNGAMYAWESTDDGRETCPRRGGKNKDVPILCGELEQHITADVAYAAHQYFAVSGDADFQKEKGAEIFLRSAMFWSSRMTKEPDGAYHIRRIMGPDEYHEIVDDNTYTNFLAGWILKTASRMTREISGVKRSEETAAGIEPDDNDLKLWEDQSRKIYIPGPENGVMPQFQGWFDLEDAASDAQHLEPPLSKYKILKQPDLLMLFHLFPLDFETASLEANLDYYEPLTTHASSLSPAIHASLNFRLNRVLKGMKFLRHSLALDIEDWAGNSSHGLHFASMGGNWQAVFYGIAGINCRDDELYLSPVLPRELSGISLSFVFKNNPVKIKLAAGTLSVEAAQPVKINIYGEKLNHPGGKISLKGDFNKGKAYLEAGAVC
ncbi:MAG: hypothetical protein M1269_06750 [Chloroflexi bacterium]|nr:hypothetical protein [Chloroflexota bacterium]